MGILFDYTQVQKKCVCDIPYHWVTTMVRIFQRNWLFSVWKPQHLEITDWGDGGNFYEQGASLCACVQVCVHVSIPGSSIMCVWVIWFACRCILVVFCLSFFSQMKKHAVQGITKAKVPSLIYQRRRTQDKWNESLISCLCMATLIR